MDGKTIAKTIKTEFGNIEIERAESVTIKFLDGTRAVLTRIKNKDGKEHTLFTGELIDEPTDAGVFLSHVVHDIESRDDPDMWETCPREWTILREAMYILTDDNQFDEHLKMCASCGNFRPENAGVKE